jgi:hypothetical protein
MAATSGPVACSAADFHALFHTILSTMDNQARREAENVIVRSLRTHTTVPFLVQLLQQISSEPHSAGIRQLSAILLRKRIFSLWRNIDVALQTELKGILLCQLGVEPNKMVRFAIAHVVSVLAKAEAREGLGWPELQVAIFNAMHSEHLEMRELAMVLAYSIAEAVGDHAVFINGIGEALVAGVSDPEIAVRLAALKAVSVTVPFLHGSNKSAKQALIDAVIPRCTDNVRSGLHHESQTSLVLRTLDVLEQFVEDLHSKAHAQQLLAIASLLLEVLVIKGAPLRIREHCSEILALLVQLKPKFVVAQGLAQRIVDACVTVLAEDETISLQYMYDEGDDDDMDDDDVELLKVRTACMFSGKLLSVCMASLPSKQMTAATMVHVESVVHNPHASTLHKKGAVIVLACIAEGNPGYLRRRAGSLVLPFTERLMNDSHPVPREAAAFSLMFFCQHLQPEILTHHARLIPMLSKILDDENDNVRSRAAHTLEQISEHLAENLEPYVASLMPQVLAAIPKSSLHTQENLCGAISSIAQTRCAPFLPFASQCLALFHGPMSSTDLPMTGLRAKATEAVGIIALSMPREQFDPYFPFFFGQVMQHFTSKRSELRESSFGFFANMTEVYGADFLPYLDATVRVALESILEDTGRYENKHLLAGAEMAGVSALLDGAQGQTGDVEGGNNVENDDDDDDSDRAEEIHCRVRTADMEEKCAAVYFVGVAASVLKLSFPPVIAAECWTTLLDVANHFHENLRSNAIESLTKLVIGALPDGLIDAAVAASVAEDPLPPHLRQTLNTLLYDIIGPAMVGDTDKTVVSTTCDSFSLVVNSFKRFTFEHDFSDIIDVIRRLLRQEATCQSNEEDDDDDEDSGADGDANAHHPDLGEDHDGQLMDSVCDTIDTLAMAYGEAFDVYFQKLAPDLLAYMEEGRPAEDFIMAGGVLGNCLVALGSKTSQYFAPSMELALRVLDETDESAAKANCCFILRALVDNCPQLVTAESLNRVLAALWAVAGSDSEIPEASDNAVSAACTIVQKLPHLAPLAQIVPPLLLKLPMQVDREENKNAVRMLVFLLSTPAVAVLDSVMESFVECVARVLSDRLVDLPDKQQVVQAVQAAYGTTQDRLALWRSHVAKIRNPMMRNSLSKNGL